MAALLRRVCRADRLKAFRRLPPASLQIVKGLLLTLNSLLCVVGARLLEIISSATYSSKGEIDEGLRLGDYPVLPWRSAQEERPKGWWDEQDRRDKETPVCMCCIMMCVLVYGWEAIASRTIVLTLVHFL